jgi:hypothetical protein
MPQIQDYIGNFELLKLHKTAFLCSRKTPASAVLKCYDWAVEQRNSGNCIISGFHSQLEKDVLYYLLKGHQPIIVALARGLKTNLEPEFEKIIHQGRLLIISPFNSTVRRVSVQTANARNQLMVNLADAITVGYMGNNSSLTPIISGINKPVIYLS